MNIWELPPNSIGNEQKQGFYAVFQAGHMKT